MTRVKPELAQKALTLIFGTEASLPDPGRIKDLDESVFRAAYRKQALRFHPDRADTLGVDPAKLEELFKRLHGAYRLVNRIVSGDVEVDVPADTRIITPEEPVRTHAPQHRAYAPADKGVYQGPMPGKPLRFAQFLYYSGLIDWQTMIDAITWQMHVRPKIGEIGRAYRFFDHGGIGEIIREREIGELFGNVALRLGKVNRLQLHAMVGKQRNLNLPIGRFFLEEEMFSRTELETLLKENRNHNIFAKRAAG